MSQIWRTFAWVMLVAFLLSGTVCSRPPEGTVQLGREFSLAPGQRVSIASEPLQIRFIEVVSDSRCPRGVTCVWAGEVSCLIDITYLGSPNTKTLTQPGSSEGKASFNDYSLTFSVQPYPEAGKQIAKDDYRLELVVGKGS